jgi:ATP-dependent RNA helicase DeaD
MTHAAPGAASTFPALGVAPEWVAALGKQGITQPTAIQREALPELLAGHDACLTAETGTGKTLAYLLPIFCRLDVARAGTQAVVLAPTHELALQIHRQCCDLAQNAGVAVRSLLLMGGTSMERQVEKLKTRPHVVVGTPGRVRDLIGMGKLKAQAVRCVVVDEADRLLVGESLGVVRAILASVPAARQLVFASATRQAESEAVIQALAPAAVLLQPGADAVNANITHLYVVCQARERIRLLRQLLAAMNPERALVFADVSETAERATSQLDHHGIPVAELHADFGKFDRKQAMDDFRRGAARVLVASDVAARGLDFPGVTHVFNLDAPRQSRAYLHRAGRTGRAGAKGVAVTLLAEDEVRLVRRYETDLGIAMQRVRLREGRLVSVGGPGADE